MIVDYRVKILFKVNFTKFSIKSMCLFRINYYINKQHFFKIDDMIFVKTKTSSLIAAFMCVTTLWLLCFSAAVN